MKNLFRTAFFVALVTSLSLAGNASAQAVRGVAELGITKPVTKVEGKTVITTMTVKNLSKGSISGLKVSEFWYDKDGNSAAGGTVQLRQPLSEGAVKTLTLKTRWTNKMDRNSDQFLHANGEIKTVVLAKIE